MDHRNLFSEAKDVKEFQAGAIIFKEGDPADVMYVVLDGDVEIQAGSRVFEIGPGDILGEMALIDSKSRSASAVAKSACRLAPVDVKHFLFMVQETPFFSLHVMRVLADRLRFIHKQP